MVNPLEQHVKEKYIRNGWKVLHRGAPDFLAFKVDKEGKILDVVFIEVKGLGFKLTHAQELYRKALEEFFKAKYVVETPKLEKEVKPEATMKEFGVSKEVLRTIYDMGGSSRQVSLPKEFLNNLKAGDTVEITYHDNILEFSRKKLERIG